MMMRLIFSDHVKRRMKERKISASLIKRIIKKPDYHFSDTITGHTVLVKQILFKQKKRFIAVSIEEGVESVILVSVHPIRDRDFIFRTKNRRWT